jgi:hypothetical protein
MAKRHDEHDRDDKERDGLQGDERYPQPKPAPDPTPVPTPHDTPEPPPPPVLSQLLPTFATIGDPNFALRVIGSGFTPDSTIVFAGQDEPITYLSPGEMTTGVNMALWLGPDANITVTVRNLDGQVSNELIFEFKAPIVVEAPPPDPSQPLPKIDQI